MIHQDIEKVSSMVNDLLAGSTLDEIRVYSVVIQLGFLRRSIHEGKPSEIWVSISGDAEVVESEGVAMKQEDFRLGRSAVLARSFLLVGEDVVRAGVEGGGLLWIDFGGRRIRIDTAEKNMEEVWAVMSGSPDLKDQPKWHISLDDTGILAASIPD